MRTMPAKYAFEPVIAGTWGNEDKNDENDVVCYRAADFDYEHLKVNESAGVVRNIAPSEFVVKALRPGDILIEKSGGGEKTLVGRSVLFDSDKAAVCSNFVSVLRPKSRQSSRYWNYQLAALYSNRGTEPFIKQSTGIQNLDVKAYLSQHVPVRSFEEQERIADELDRELAEIDEFIADQQRLLELEDERFKSTITSLVHPEPIKDIFNSKINSIEWNGTTWRRTHLGMVTSINEGQVDPREEQYSSMMLIAPNHIESGTGRILYTETAAEQGADSGKYLVNKGQVIFSKIRPTLLKSTIAPQDCLCSADMYGMSANPDYLTNEFLMWFLLSKPFETFAKLNSDRVAMPKLNRETFSSTPIWFPNTAYQINLKLKSNLDVFNLNKILICKSINLLQNKKKSIITSRIVR